MHIMSLRRYTSPGSIVWATHFRLQCEMHSSSPTQMIRPESYFTHRPLTHHKLLNHWLLPVQIGYGSDVNVLFLRQRSYSRLSLRFSKLLDHYWMQLPKNHSSILRPGRQQRISFC